MKINSLLLAAMLSLAGSFAASAHDLAAVDTAAPAWFTEPSAATFVAPAGNGTLMASSFAPFKPKVRYFWDGTYFYEESDGIPDRTRMPNLMVGITSWQQQVPLPTSYFSSTTNGTTNTGSLGYLQPNYWRIPLVPVAAASPISLTGNFLRGAVALGADGVAIFNPRNNTGQFSQAIGELDAYGGHCGLGDDYHYHIFPTHLTSVLGNDKPIAWALDGYPVYGYVEPDGSAMLALDADGGHNHGTWGYHYHARGTLSGSTWTPASPYMMSAMHGTVVNFDSQIDPQPTGSGLRGSGTGGYTAVPVAGATITAFKNPVALTTDGSGNFIENVGGVASDDSWLMRYTVSGTTYDLCWKLNRSVNPRTLTMTWRLPTISPTTMTYSNSGNRITQYAMAAASQAGIPDTSQTLDTTATFGEDADYALSAQSFTDHGNSTITDNVTGLMWQKVDNGESTWENAVTNAAGVTTGGFTDWRLPTPSELFSIFNHNNAQPSFNATFFPNNPVGTAGYFWTSDIYGASTTNVWCANSGGGLGPKPKAETISAGGTLRYHARYVRGAKPTNAHNYLNNGDSTITDLDTSLMWTKAPGSAVAWDAALAYAEGLTTGGFSDWRLPNIKELQTLTDYARASATATTTAPSIQRTLFPTATANAYWSSTTVKGPTTTEAWLVELGVNTASTPPRGSQGIISYGVKTETYPVFAVRTAVTIATQIAVEQPTGSALSDGASTVAYGSVNVGGTLAKTFTIRNNSTTTALSISGVTIDGTNLANFTVTTAPANSIAASGSTTMVVQFSAASAGAKTAALHIASSDASVGAAFDIALSGTGAIAPPTITGTLTSPNTPTYVDGVYVTANLQAASGATIANAQLTYTNGSQSTATVFTETMAATATAAMAGWDGTGAINPWTITNTGGGAGNVKQTTAANHGTGNICGLDMNKGSATATQTMAATTNAINAVGTSGYVEFWVATTNVTAGLGWTFQLSTDGTTWTTRLSELAGSVHGYVTVFHYDLLPAERVSTLKMRFQFIGNGVGGASAPSVQIDDIKVVTTTGSAPVALTMFDDGLHGDGLAGDGIYGALIPVLPAGAVVTYSITATDSNGGVSTSTTAGTYTVSATTPAANFTATATASASNVIIQWPSQVGINYSVQWSADLLTWNNIPVGQTATWTDTTATGVPRRFYRVSR